jgi:hypothetical protein
MAINLRYSQLSAYPSFQGIDEHKKIGFQHIVFDPSAYMVSKAKLDLPDPDNPVKTTSFSFGTFTETFFKLCSEAPIIFMYLFILTIP